MSSRRRHVGNRVRRPRNTSPYLNIPLTVQSGEEQCDWDFWTEFVHDGERFERDFRQVRENKRSPSGVRSPGECGFLTSYACRCNTDTVLVPMITIHSHAPLYDIVTSGTWTPSITCLQVDLMSPLIRMRHSVIR